MATRAVSKLARIWPIVAAYSDVFTADDALGFPEPMPPARKIGLGRRSLTGFLTSGRKVDGLGAFESALERDFFVLLEFNPLVLAWHPQPVRLKVPTSEGKRAKHYTPDVAVEYTDAPGGTELQRVELCEVKYRDDLKENWAKLKPSFKAARAYARSQGWKFTIYTEDEIRTPRLKNAKFILPYGVRGIDDGDIARIAMELRPLGKSSPTTFLRRFDVSERGRFLGVLWHMVAKGYVVMDFDREITMSSDMYLHEHAPV